MSLRKNKTHGFEDVLYFGKRTQGYNSVKRSAKFSTFFLQKELLQIDETMLGHL